MMKDDSTCLVAAPSLVLPAEFLKVRELEVRALIEKLKGKGTGHRRSFQLLPKELRRRAQSHDPYRVPKRLRAGLFREFDTASPKPSKRRRHDTRRLKECLQNYARRARKNNWLPDTHLWHAKRFHMGQLWGNFRVPLRACEKQGRKIYRHASRRCLIHDASYFKTIEIEGATKDILSCCRILGPAAQFWLQPHFFCGYVTRRFVLRSLEGAVAPGEALWEPLRKENATAATITPSELYAKRRRLWIWVHGAALEMAFEAINAAVCKVNPRSQMEEIASTTSLDSKDRLCARLISEFSRFEVRGRLAPHYLKVCLEVTADTEPAMLQISQGTLPDGFVLPLRIRQPPQLGPFPLLPKPSFQEPEAVTATERYAFPANGIFDPGIRKDAQRPPERRLVRRSKKRKDVGHILEKLRLIQERFLEKKETLTSLNPLLDCEFSTDSKSSATAHCKGSFRTAVTAMIDDGSELATTSHFTSPGRVRDGNPSGSSETTVPILLVRRKKFLSRIAPSNYLTGWDIIVPPRCGGGIIWQLFTRRGARAIGILEKRDLVTTVGGSLFPWDYPEYPAAAQVWSTSHNKALQKWRLRPASKRINFALTAVPFPFAPNWGALMKPECADTTLWNPLFPSNSTVEVYRLNAPDNLSPIPGDLRDLIQSLMLCSDKDERRRIKRRLMKLFADSLVAVTVLCPLGGVPGPCDHLYLMSKKDLSEVAVCQQTALTSPKVPKISIPVDQSYKTKKVPRPQRNSSAGCFGSDDFCQAHLPKLAGFLTSGRHSLCTGGGLGVGCVSMEGLVTALTRVADVPGIKAPWHRPVCQKSELQLFAVDLCACCLKISDEVHSEEKTLNRIKMPFWLRSIRKQYLIPCYITLT